MAKKEQRFIKTEHSGVFADPCTTVLVDKKTGVNYLWVSEGYAGGLTPLLDRDGKPIISALPIEE